MPAFLEAALFSQSATLTGGAPLRSTAICAGVAGDCDVLRAAVDPADRERRELGGGAYVTGRSLRRRRGSVVGGTAGDPTAPVSFPNSNLGELSDERLLDSAFNSASATAAASAADVFSPHTATFVNGIVVTNVSARADGPAPVPIGDAFPSAAAAPGVGAAVESVAAPCGPALRLTGAHADQAGAAWYGRSLNVREGFDAAFAFRLSSPSGASACRDNDDADTLCRSRGGGGFAFVVQSWHPGALGLGGTDGMGYASIRSSVAVEFDTHADAGPGGDDGASPLHEPHENHVSVHTRGPAAGNSANHTYSLGHVAGDKLPDLADGTHLARVVYSPAFSAAAAAHPAFTGAGSAYLAALLGGGAPLPPAPPPSAGSWAAAARSSSAWQRDGFGTLSVYVDDAADPVLIVPLNLAAAVDMAASHGRAWVGFTASTGGAVWQVHDVLAWHFTELRADAPFV